MRRLGRTTSSANFGVSQFSTTQAVIEALKLGAFDFITKDKLAFNFKVVVEAALKEQAQLRSAKASRPQLTVEQHQDSIVGQSDAMQQVFKLTGRVAYSLRLLEELGREVRMLDGRAALN